jgi:hypothetical protein
LNPELRDFQNPGVLCVRPGHGEDSHRRDARGGPPSGGVAAEDLLENTTTIPSYIAMISGQKDFVQCHGSYMCVRCKCCISVRQ